MNRSLQIFLVVLITLLSQQMLIAQQVQGRILEQGSGTPLPGIAILSGERVLGVSDAHGAFSVSLPNVEAAVRLTFRGVGYEMRTISVSGARRDLSVLMRPSMNFLDDLVVTTTRRERPIKDEPVITHVFSAAQIAKLSATSVQDVLTSVIPGVQFESQRMGNGSTQSVRIQGLGGSYVMFLLDGEPLSSKNGENSLKARGGQIDFSRIDVSNIERIEYLPSGGSILYGSNSIGGVVNIISKRAKAPFSFRLGTHQTLPTEQRYETSLGMKRGRLDTRLGLTHIRRREFVAYEGIAYDQFGIPIRDYTGQADSLTRISSPASHVWTANWTAGYQLNDRITLRGGTNASANILYLRNEDRELRTRSYDTYGAGARLSARVRLGQGHTLDVSTSLEHALREIDIYVKRTKLSEQRQDYANTLAVARLTYTLEYGPAHTTLAGLENTYEHGRSQWLERAEGHVSNTAVAFVQHDAKFFAGKMLLSYGLRYDHNSSFGGKLLHRLSLMQKVGAVDLRALYSESFRTPSLTERYARVSDPLGRGTLVGNPDLRPETSRRYTFQVGYNSRMFNLSASTYRADIENVIEARNETDPGGQLLVTRYNTDKSVRYYGAELMARAQMALGTYFQASYSYTRSRSRSVTGIDGQRYNTSLIRPHSINAMVGHSFGGRNYSFDINLSARFMSSVEYYQGTNQTIPVGVTSVQVVREGGAIANYYLRREDAYSNVRLSTSLRLRDAYTIQLGVDNLLNYQPTSSNYSSALTDGRRFFASLHIDVDKIWRRHPRS